MVKRFSVKAFVLATVLHLAGMVVLFDASFRALRASKSTGVQLDPLWLTMASWIWESMPMATVHLFPRLVLPHFYFVIVIMWSFVVGAIVGFLIPRVSQRHLTNR
jgi:hypothetical protein